MVRKYSEQFKRDAVALVESENFLNGRLSSSGFRGGMVV